MGYPTSVQSFATKNAGDTIQPAHINDVQTEVAAIENGLLNGLSHALTVSTGGLTVSTGSVNIGGPSSVATLQVNGNSTFAGSATVSSNFGVGGQSTFTGPVTFSTVVTFHASQTFGTGTRAPMVRLTHSAKQDIANNQWTGLSWDTETFDSTAMHSTAANSSRILLNSSGLWAITGQVEWNTSTGQFGVNVALNDTSVIGSQFVQNKDTSPVAQNVTALYLATSTSDYVTLRVYQNSGSTGSVNCVGSTSYGGAWFSAYRVSV